MPHLYKRPESAVWWCQFYLKDHATGKLRPVRKSTGQRSKKAALPAAIELERVAKGVISAGTDQSRRAKAILAEAISDLETEKFNAITARKVLAKLLEAATGEELVSYTIRSWAEEWLARKARGASVATMARYRKSVDEFCGWLTDRERKPLESVTPADARRWAEGLEASGRAGKTCEKYVKDLRAIFKAAVSEGLLSANPFSSVTVETDGGLSRKPFEIEEVARLVDATQDDEWKGLILAGAFTGLRLGDAAKLQWGSVDMIGKKITVTPSKTRKRGVIVTIPLQADFLRHLEAGDRPASGFVFPRLSGQPLNTRTGLSAAFVSIMGLAGVDRGKASRSAESGSKGKGRVIYERGFHSLRHTFTSWLRGAGVSEEDRMALTGHSTRDSHAIYSHINDSALEAAIAKLPQISS